MSRPSASRRIVLLALTAALVGWRSSPSMDLQSQAGVAGAVSGNVDWLNYTQTSSSAAGITYLQPLWCPAGTAAAPGHSFATSPGSGMSLPGVGQLAFSSNGTVALTFDTSQNATFTANGNQALKITSPSTGVGVVQVGTGTGSSYLQFGPSSSSGFRLAYKSNGNTFEFTDGTGTANTAFVAMLNLSSYYIQNVFSMTFGASGGGSAVAPAALYSNASGLHVSHGNGSVSQTIQDWVYSDLSSTFYGTVKVQNAATIRSGSAATPNSVVTGNVGDLYMSTNGGASTTLWVKESGAATNTGWVGK
jgi:hypothetical protein